jgi:saccharopine dehydrogenase-like NADP-dependent oxidoreductase
VRVVVLGAGLVGGAIARDLAAGGEFEVTVVDASQAALARLADQPRVVAIRADLTAAAEVRRVVERQDLVVGAVPGHMGLATIRNVLECRKPMVDISFFPEDPFELDFLAREAGVPALVDFGIAPGCSNLILGRMMAEFDAVERFVCLVGGLPSVPAWPWEYKAAFSPADVLEEYTRPARYVVAGRMVTMPALSEAEFVDFPGVGTLEAFNTDGLRTLISTAKVPFMQEKTLRYPGHIERIRVLRESGFLGTEPIEVGNVKVRPLDVTSRLLFPLWRLEEGEADLTVMRVSVEGLHAGRRIRRTFELLDHFDPATRTTSMARTTGYTCTAGVRLLARGLFRQAGIVPPEFVGREQACYDFVMAELGRRGVVLSEKTELLD